MSSIDLSKIFTLKYWLEGTTAGPDVNIIPVASGSFFYYFYISFFCGLIILAICISLYKLLTHKDNPIQNNLSFLSQNLCWQGILGLTWFLFRQVNISFLSARLWLLFGFAWLLVTIIWFIRYMIIYYPLEIAYFKKQKNNSAEL